MTVSTTPDAGRRAELNASLKHLLDSVNAGLNEHERLDFLVIVAEQWTVENGYITPTLKVKRPAIESAYGPQFGAWAAKKQAVLWQTLPA